MESTVWWLVIPLGIAGLIAALAKRNHQIPNETANYTVNDWQPYVKPLADAAKVYWPFAMGWIRVESGGNPCSFGAAGSNGPDGHPREQGIGQFYNPDDFQRYGIPSGSLRVYCTPGTQKCNRVLSVEQMQAQAKYLLDLIIHCRETAGKLSASNHLSWSGKDMYRLTKLVHGLPGLAKGVGTVTKKLGRPPRNWDEFKATIPAVMLDSGTERYRARFPALLANAEKVTSALPDDVRIVS